MYIQGKFLTYQDDLSKVYDIRRSVFINEQHMPEEDVFDSLDEDAVICILYEESNTSDIDYNAVATGRLILTEDNEFKIGKIAVLKQYRGKQYGDMLVKMLVNKAFMSDAKRVIVGAQIQAKGFYESIGFQTFGDTYTESGIPHILMELIPSNICKKCKNESE